MTRVALGRIRATEISGEQVHGDASEKRPEVVSMAMLRIVEMKSGEAFWSASQINPKARRRAYLLEGSTSGTY